MQRSLVGALAVLVLASVVSAKIVHSKVKNDDRALIPLSEAFGFGQEGAIDFYIRGVTVYRTPDNTEAINYNNFGVFLSSADAEASLENDLTQDRCPLAGRDVVLFTFTDQNIRDLMDEKINNFTFHWNLKNGGVFYLYFANCEPDTPVTFDARIEIYNVFKGRKDYLSVGETELDVVYWVMFGLFTLLSGLWLFVLLRSRANVHTVHWLMLSLVAFKAFTVLSQALMYYYIERTGHSDGWNIAYYIFTFFRGLLFFTVLVLVGTGWSYMKPFLGDKEKRILMVVIPLQVFANIAIVVTEEESPSEKDWFTWRDVFHLVDIICCCAVLFPIVWSIKHLREASQTDGKAAKNLEKLTLFRQFYVMVVVYIYFTRIVVYLLQSTLDFEYAWISDSANELATLAFYVWVGVKFRPHKDNPYAKLAQSEIEL